MGSWGHGIRQDDLVKDVIDSFKEHLKDDVSIADATQKIESEYAESLGDEDEAPLVYLALADAQWTYGALDSVVLSRVRSDIETQAGLERWREASASDLAKRRKALKRFLEKIEVENPRPAKLPKRVVRAPKFAPGECLSITLSNGQYGAALVLAADHSDAEYGKNLIAVLDYLEPEKAGTRVFKKRRWLRMTHHDWNGDLDISWYLPVGFREGKKRLEVVGTIRLRRGDPKESLMYSSWDEVGEQVVRQREWSSQQK
ncbi:MAG: hypothetical protein OEM62_10680 [Acidobacteriota bacterium]|nr:hypothetical protein [Acidobacteriota bacterium]